jgi:hypothetical protein
MLSAYRLIFESSAIPLDSLDLVLGTNPFRKEKRLLFEPLSLWVFFVFSSIARKQNVFCEISQKRRKIQGIINNLTLYNC